MTLRSATLVVGCLLSLPACESPLLARPTDAKPPLHRQIDTLVGKRLAESKITPAELSSDAEFVRRVNLDLTGVIPAAGQVRAFLDDPAPDKRARLIDDLLAGPEYPLHMARVFDVMLAKRRTPSPSRKPLVRVRTPLPGRSWCTIGSRDQVRAEECVQRIGFCGSGE